MITKILILRDKDDVAITYYDGSEAVEQSVFENEPLAIATSIRAVLICDAIKRALVDHPLLTGELPAPTVAGAQVDKLILDTFKIDREGDDLDELRIYVTDTITELRHR